MISVTVDLSDVVPPKPPDLPGWTVVELFVKVAGGRGRLEKTHPITAKRGPRELAAHLGGEFEEMIELWAVATDADGIDAKTCKWVDRKLEIGLGHLKIENPYWSSWR